MTSSSRRLHRTRTTSIVVVAGLATALLATTPSSAAPSPAVAVASPDTVARAQAVASGGSAHTVTLITGDVVRVTDIGNGRSTTEITRPSGATGGVHSRTIGTHTYVLPDEVLPYLAAGTVDRRLFDITGLIEQGYDDEHSAGIPLIVSYTSASAATQVVPVGATKVRTLRSVQGAALRATKRTARGVWDRLAAPGSGRTMTAPRTSTMAVAPSRIPALGAGVAAIWLDGKVHSTLADSTAQIGSAQAWAAGYDGHGVKVAILDTGVDLEHPDFAGRISAAESFVPGETVQDGNSHGTHTASTVGGSGAASDGLEKGVAPGADLMIGKVLADMGYGEDSWVIAGMEWAATHGAKVISMSLSGSDPSNGTEPMCQATDALSAAHDVLFVVAAGNAGAEGVMSCPSAAESALTVGAVDSTDTIADFSSRGPRWGDYGMKPDVSAPGVDILAAKAGGSAESGWYQSMSGTSMATPHVAGAAAILLQEHPTWSAQDVKNALMSTSRKLTDYTSYQVGAGRVDLANAITSTITATGSTYFGFAAWPHTAPATESRTITYANSGDAAVTLTLGEQVAVAGGPFDVDPTIDAGTPAPDGMFALSAPTVTVPAHGTASVTATANPALAANGRRYLGEVTATVDGTVAARTQVGLYSEDERYSLTIKVTRPQREPGVGLHRAPALRRPGPDDRARRRDRRAHAAPAARHLQPRHLPRRARLEGARLARRGAARRPRDRARPRRRRRPRRPQGGGGEGGRARHHREPRAVPRLVPHRRRVEHDRRAVHAPRVVRHHVRAADRDRDAGRVRVRGALAQERAAADRDRPWREGPALLAGRQPVLLGIEAVHDRVRRLRHRRRARRRRRARQGRAGASLRRGRRLDPRSRTPQRPVPRSSSR